MRREARMILGTMAALLLAGPAAMAEDASAPGTVTPIEHLIVVVGENLSFDHLFATYRPPPGETVANLLAKGIVKDDGSPGANFAHAAQWRAEAHERYQVTPRRIGTYAALPRPGTTYARGLPRNTIDERFPADLANGPFAITRYADAAAFIGDPVHRFFQMWQQFDGGRNDLFVWVAESSGEGSPKRDDPNSATGQGALAMGFFNMGAGDAAYLATLARHFALADNYHQPMMGGTGANYFALATGDVGVYLDDGKPAVPPANQIENPDPRPGTNNRYTQSGYRSGSYVACADAKQPGVAAIRAYLAALPYRVFAEGNCQDGHYYLVNNYRPGFTPEGARKPLGPTQYTLPPQNAPTIAEALAAHGIAWKWYSGGRRGGTIDRDAYCDICDTLTFSTAVMEGKLRQNLQGLDALERDLGDAKTFPAVAFVVPPNLESGHPAYSTLANFENFLRDFVTKLQAHPALWAHSALLITTDEGGGYYDSGEIQILDFFGDGTRVAMIAVSPYARSGHVEHTYYDHVSILKFIERNWRLKPLSARSRDHLPNPVMSAADPYMPSNRPAIGDLMELFDFTKKQD